MRGGGLRGYTSKGNSMFRTLLAGPAIAATLALAPGLAFADVTVGQPRVAGGDCAPFGCAIRYQQAYDASLFSGAIDIVGLTFHNSEIEPYDLTSIAPATYTIRLSSGGGSVGALSTTFDNNLGADVATFFAGALSGPTGAQFTISGSLFHYDPAAGDLVVDVTKSGGGSDFSAFLDYRDDFTGFQRVFSYEDTVVGSADSNWGLVTTFNTAAIPEPATWALMIGGFGMAGVALRRRRALAG
jgi:hypothetical protein